MQLKIKNNRGVYEIRNEAFDEYCLTVFLTAGAEQKEKLPTPLSAKLNKLKRTRRGIERFSFVEKLYILWHGFGLPFYLLLRSNQNPLTTDDFIKLNQLYDEKPYSIEAAEFVLDTFGFVLSHDDLVTTMIYSNSVTKTPGAKYLTKAKNSPLKGITDFEEHRNKTDFFAALLFNYENVRLRFMADNDLTMAEWLILLYLFDRKHKLIKGFVERHKNIKGTSRYYVMNAFVHLRERGLVEKHGSGKKTVTHTITTAGFQLVEKIIVHYILNF